MRARYFENLIDEVVIQCNDHAGTFIWVRWWRNVEAMIGICHNLRHDASLDAKRNQVALAIFVPVVAIEGKRKNRTLIRKQRLKALQLFRRVERLRRAVQFPVVAMAAKSDQVSWDKMSPKDDWNMVINLQRMR